MIAGPRNGWRSYDLSGRIIESSLSSALVKSANVYARTPTSKSVAFACRGIVRSRGRFLMRGHLWRALKGEVMLVQVLIGFIVERVLAVQEGLCEWSGGLTTRSLCVFF